MNELYYWFALRDVPLVGNVTYKRLVDHFGAPRAVLAASEDELRAAPGIGPAVARSLKTHDYRPFADREAAAVAERRIRVITIRDDGYPPLLREITDPPPYLYLQGCLPAPGPAIAVVGSRSCSEYGVAITARLSRELAERGVTVISGMARGVDAAAHRSALQVGGTTIGVLGCGVDVIYPAENRPLFRQMAERGAIVSEFPLGATPAAENFPRRNRIISGLAQGVLVVEAAEKSGSLITARCALDQGREVFAVPGNITHRTSRGTNSLIKQGATLVEGVEDILAELPPGGGTRPAAAASALPNLAPDEERMVGFLADGPLHIDDLIVRSGLTVGEVSVMLLRLELQGVVMQLPGKYFAVA